MRKSIIIGLALLWAGSATAQSTRFDPRELKGSQAGPPTQMLTLGSTHLSQMKVVVDASMMSALLDKLAAYKPEIITVENVAGEQCEHLKRYVGVYPDSYESWCRDPALAQKAVGLDVPQAAEEIRKTFAAWPAEPSPAQRRRLAAVFLAAGEWPSGVLQWRKLAPAERHAGDGVTEDTIKFLDRVGSKPNETYEVGVALALRLGLERIYQVDDHTSDGPFADEPAAFGETVQAAWKMAPSKAVEQQQNLEAGLKTPDDVLRLYRFINQPDTLRQNVRADFGANLAQPSPGLYGRHYVAGWEVRNLRMVSNIVAASTTHPGARVLNIVGSSHKAYYDALLDMMHDVNVIDAEQVLK